MGKSPPSSSEKGGVLLGGGAEGVAKRGQMVGLPKEG